MNDNGSSGGGFLLNRRKKTIHRKDTLSNMGDLEDDGKFKFYTSPQLRVYQLEAIMQSSIDRKLAEDEDNRLYDPVRAKLMCQALSKDARNKLKELNINRYRIVCVFSIVEKRLQTINYKMVFCIDAHLDYYACFNFETAEYYILATIYMVYKDWVGTLAARESSDVSVIWGNWVALQG